MAPVFARPVKALGIMNVWVLLPWSKMSLAVRYITRSVLLPTTHAATGMLVDPIFAKFVTEHYGVKIVRLSILALFMGVFDVFRYAPVKAVFNNLRNKRVSKSAVMRGEIKGVSLPPNTRIYKVAEALRIWPELVKKKTVFQLERGDGGYGTLIFTPGTTPTSKLLAMLRSVSRNSSIVVADFDAGITHTVGVPITPYGVICPNGNMSFKDSADTVGVFGPIPSVLANAKWVCTAMEVASNVRDYILKQVHVPFFMMNVDLGITNHGASNAHFFEINPRMTMSHLVTSGIWKSCQKKGKTALDYYTFLSQLNSGKLGMAYIAVDKIDIGERNFAQISACLAKAGLQPFNGVSGWLPTRQQYKGQIGLIFVHRTGNGVTALRSVKTMYLSALKCLGTHPKGELDGLGV